MPTKTTPEVLLVTKPLVPPWDDSAKNLARAQLAHASTYRYRALVAKDMVTDLPSDACDQIPLYGNRGSYAAGLRQNLRVFAYGARPRGAALYHFFFAPNPVTSSAGRVLRSLARVPCVQTICSVPKDPERLASLLFADRIIALSEHSRRLCLSAGVPPGRVHLVRPGIEPLPRPSAAKRAELKQGLGLKEETRLVLYPGDLEFSSASRTVAAAAKEIVSRHAHTVVVFACRAKTPAAARVKEELRRDLAEQERLGQVLFLGSVPDMPGLAGASDVVVLPADTLYAKMDAPLVILEAMSQAVPVILADIGPLAELVELGGALGVAPADPARLATAVSTILTTPGLASALGAKGASVLTTRFSAGGMARAVEAIYDEVLQ